MPNAFGGREDLDAVAFLKELNELVHAREPGVISAAEESTAWPGVSRPTYVGGLGFGFKWNMGWMHDTLELLPARSDPPPLPPPRADLLARLRVERELHPPALARRGRARQGLAAREDAGRPLAAAREPARALRVHVGAPRQEAALHGRRARDAVGVGAPGRAAVVAARARRARGHARPGARPEPVYREEPALWEVDFSHEGFRWIEPNDAMKNVLAFMRVSADKSRKVVCVANLSPVPRESYRVGLPAGGALARAPEHGLDALRRHRGRQPRRGEGRGARLARPAVLGRGDAAAAGGGLAASGRVSRRRVQLSPDPGARHRYGCVTTRPQGCAAVRARENGSARGMPASLALPHTSVQDAARSAR